MSLKWNNKYTERQRNALISEAKKLSLNSTSLGIHSVISTSIDFHDDITQYEASILVAKALTLLRNNRINESDLLHKIDELQRTFLSKQKKIFHILTNLSINNDIIINSIKHKDIEVVFLRKFPSKYKRDSYIEKNIGRINRLLQNSKLPSKYRPVIIKLEASTARTAMKRALDFLDFIIGVWNYYLNIQKNQTFFFENPKEAPINKIIKGPIHTIHDKEGNINNEVFFYYELDYNGPVNCYNIGQDLKKLRKFERFIKRRILMNRIWGLKIKNSFARYTRSLEKLSFNNSFLELWSILEYLTSTNNSESNHNITIKRISNIYSKDQVLYESLLNHLRITRNSLVHESDFQEQRANLTHEIKKFTEQIIEYHLSAIKIFDNYGEALEFLDLPSDKYKIQRRLKLLDLFYKNRFS